MTRVLDLIAFHPALFGQRYAGNRPKNHRNGSGSHQKGINRPSLVGEGVQERNIPNKQRSVFREQPHQTVNPPRIRCARTGINISHVCGNDLR